MLEHFLLLEALRDSKIPYLFLTDLVSEKKKCLAILLFVIKTINQLNYHRKMIFLHLSEILGKLELPGMNYFSSLEKQALVLELYILAGSKYC